MREFRNYVLLADSGYTIKHYIITPMLNAATEVEQLFNESQIRIRNPIERSYSV